MDGGGDAVALGVAEEEEDELEFPAVVLPAVALPPLAAVLFPVVFCANVEVVKRYIMLYQIPKSLLVFI